MDSLVHISRDGKNIGAYSAQEIHSQLKSGQLRPDDLAWQEGMTGWQPLRTVVMIAPPLPPSLPAVAPAVLTPLLVSPTSAQPPSVHVKIEKKGCMSGCGTVFALLIILGFISSLFNERKPKVEDKPAPEGNLVLINSGKTTEVRKNQQLKKTLEFRGQIKDVQMDNKLEARIDSNNYATVMFAESSDKILNLQKDQIIEFTAKIESFGTGILFNHQLIDACLTKAEPLALDEKSKQ